MLSIVDIKRELGKNIYIYPLNTSAIKSNSVDLSASRFAWSISTKKSLFNGVDKIVIPPHDTALIYTQEAIYVSNKIGGNYHSKVRYVSRGLGHIGTNLDAQYIGLSIIAFHNTTDREQEILVGDEMVTITFYYLHSPDYADTISHDNPPGHPNLISGFEGVDEFHHWREQNRWSRSKSILYFNMIESDEYKKCKQQFEKEQMVFNRKFWKNKVLKYCVIVLLWLMLSAGLAIPAYIVQIPSISTICAVIIENFSIPFILSILIPIIVTDYRERRM